MIYFRNKRSFDKTAELNENFDNIQCELSNNSLEYNIILTRLEVELLIKVGKQFRRLELSVKFDYLKDFREASAQSFQAMR